MRIMLLLALASSGLAADALAQEITCGAYAEAAESIAANHGGIPEALIPKAGHVGSYITGVGRKEYGDLSVLYRNLVNRSHFLSEWFAPLVATMCIRKGEMGPAFDDIGVIIKDCYAAPDSKNAFRIRMKCLRDSGILSSSEVVKLVAEKSSAFVPAPSMKK